MKRGMIALLTALAMAAMFTGGCANKDVVKSEEPVVKTDSTADSAAKPVQQPYFKADENKVEPAKPAQDQQSAVTASASATYGFETIYFDFDKSDLSKDARNSLNKNAELLLKAKKDANIQIEGHCDERGSAEYNLALGERRAKSAQQYLLTLGVKAERLSVISYGKEKPAVQGSDEAAWSKNRRAEFVPAK